MIFKRWRDPYKIPAGTDDALTALLGEILLDSTIASLEALERAGAIDLSRFRAAWAGPGSEHYELLLKPVRYRAYHCAAALAQWSASAHPFGLVDVMTAAYNDAIGELRHRRIVDTRKLAAGYRGVGSDYYDRVTEQMQAAQTRGLPRIFALIGPPDAGTAAPVNRSGTPAP